MCLALPLGFRKSGITSGTGGHELQVPVLLPAKNGEFGVPGVHVLVEQELGTTNMQTLILIPLTWGWEAGATRLAGPSRFYQLGNRLGIGPKSAADLPSPRLDCFEQNSSNGTFGRINQNSVHS